MANNKSAKKRIKISNRNKVQNNSYRSLMKTSKKQYLRILSINQTDSVSGDGNSSTDRNTKGFLKPDTEEALKFAISKIDRAVKKKVIHKNTGARRKSRLVKAFTQVQK